MATPRKKISIHKKNMRHSTRLRVNLNSLSDSYALTKCSNCGKYHLSHRVCHHCGYYKGKQVITIKAKGGKKILEA